MNQLPFLYINRAVAAPFIYPEHPIQVVAISELVSVIDPILNPKLFAKIIVYAIAIIYNPMYASALIYNFKKKDYVYYEAELCSLLLFLTTLFIQNI